MMAPSRGAKRILLISIAVLAMLFVAIQPNNNQAVVGIDYVVPAREQNKVHPVSDEELTLAPAIIYADAPYAPTLQLSEAERQLVLKRQQRRDPSRPCPNRFLFVNTHTYGRHHNQLQEMLNLAAWAERLGRTAVLGWFRFSHRWIDASDLYNFTRIAESYCLITPDEFGRRLASLDASVPRTAACLGQKFDDTPLKKIIRGRLRCQLSSDVPAHYNTRNGMRITKEYFQSHVAKSDATLLVVSGQLGFFLRPGLAEVSAVFGLLEPTATVSRTMIAFREKSYGPGAASTGYFGIHLRRREAECLKELAESKEDGASLLRSMSDDDWKVATTQCAITVQHVTALMVSLRLLIDHQTMFLGSDHQDMKLEAALVERGAVMFKEGDSGGLTALAVDYFTLSEGRYFTGNQLSSITQNVCYRRLGRGMQCHGFNPAFTRYHARNVETGASFVRSFGVVEAAGDSNE